MAARPSIYRAVGTPARPSIYRSESVAPPSGPTTYPDIDSVPSVDTLADVDTLTES